MKRKAPLTTINFNAKEFHAQWGFMPRGSARWGFYFSDAPDTLWHAFEAPSSYQAAKLMARKEAEARGVTAVRVQALPMEFKLADE